MGNEDVDYFLMWGEVLFDCYLVQGSFLQLFWILHWCIYYIFMDVTCGILLFSHFALLMNE